MFRPGIAINKEENSKVDELQKYSLEQLRYKHMEVLYGMGIDNQYTLAELVSAIVRKEEDANVNVAPPSMSSTK